MPTPLGDLVVAWSGAALVVADFADSGLRLDGLIGKAFKNKPQELDVPAVFRDRFTRYFNGEIAALDGVPVAPVGTPFQLAMWRGLRAVPPGERLTYGAMAARLGLSATAARAVGRANALNPISVVIPCHRLTGADGTLTGYAGGLHRKAWLLRHEGRLV
ncbi:methylated-DNA--[protein]-cysteine S-methyltransferase [Caenispirillum bisanense]|uniref:methylated-DNA--[protein]-cysteine S-methyltransferase n=1 Tax=Caenispirillum bisanense TaxID=414052 RepID=UPI001FE79234|nr:methylated-DNA--[protein]-cysteine S-methyltransferase [Caenispirillum bisanense]